MFNIFVEIKDNDGNEIIPLKFGWKYSFEMQDLDVPLGTIKIRLGNVSFLKHGETEEKRSSLTLQEHFSFCLHTFCLLGSGAFGQINTEGKNSYQDAISSFLEELRHHPELWEQFQTTPNKELLKQYQKLKGKTVEDSAVFLKFIHITNQLKIPGIALIHWGGLNGLRLKAIKFPDELITKRCALSGDTLTTICYLNKADQEAVDYHYYREAYNNTNHTDPFRRKINGKNFTLSDLVIDEDATHAMECSVRKAEWVYKLFGDKRYEEFNENIWNDEVSFEEFQITTLLKKYNIVKKETETEKELYERLLRNLCLNRSYVLLDDFFSHPIIQAVEININATASNGKNALDLLDEKPVAANNAKIHQHYYQLLISKGANFSRDKKYLLRANDILLALQTESIQLGGNGDRTVDRKLNVLRKIREDIAQGYPMPGLTATVATTYLGVGACLEMVQRFSFEYLKKYHEKDITLVFLGDSDGSITSDNHACLLLGATNINADLIIARGNADAVLANQKHFVTLHDFFLAQPENCILADPFLNVSGYASVLPSEFVTYCEQHTITHVMSVKLYHQTYGLIENLNMLENNVSELVNVLKKAWAVRENVSPKLFVHHQEERRLNQIESKYPKFGKDYAKILRNASNNGDVGTVKELIELKKARHILLEIDAAGKDGVNALGHAMKKGHKEIELWLVNAGADPSRHHVSSFGVTSEPLIAPSTGK